MELITHLSDIAYPTASLFHPTAPGPHPLLVVFDGKDYVHRGRLVYIVEALIAAKRMQPIALALVDNAGPKRFIEYACNDSTVSFITNQVIALVNRDLNLLDPQQHPGCHALLGASMGGMMAPYTALRVPSLFGQGLENCFAF